jgi:hypothetical protein
MTGPEGFGLPGICGVSSRSREMAFLLRVSSSGTLNRRKADDAYESRRAKAAVGNSLSSDAYDR